MPLAPRTPNGLWLNNCGPQAAQCSLLGACWARRLLFLTANNKARRQVRHQSTSKSKSKVAAERGPRAHGRLILISLSCSSSSVWALLCDGGPRARSMSGAPFLAPFLITRNENATERERDTRTLTHAEEGKFFNCCRSQCARARLDRD